MASPLTSRLRFLDADGVETTGPREWRRSYIEIDLPSANLERVRLLRQGEPMRLVVASLARLRDVTAIGAQVPIPDGHEISGVVQVDQSRSISWKQRRSRFIGQTPAAVLDEVRARLQALLSL